MITASWHGRTIASRQQSMPRLHSEPGLNQVSRAGLNQGFSTVICAFITHGAGTAHPWQRDNGGREPKPEQETRPEPSSTKNHGNQPSRTREKQSQEQVLAYEYEGVRYDCGSKLGYLKATVDFALRHPEVKDGFKEFLKTR